MAGILSAVLILLMFAGCSAVSTPGTAARSVSTSLLSGRTWAWEETVTPREKIAVAVPDRYTVGFGEDGKARFRFDCNRGSGTYQAGAGTITFGPMMSTRMACPSDSQDALFMRDLERVNSFFVEGDNLFLELKPDGGTMRFRPAPP